MPPKIASFLKRPGLTSWPSSGGAASSGSSAFFGFLAMRPPTPSHENAAGRGRPLFRHWPVTVNGTLSRSGPARPIGGRLAAATGSHGSDPATDEPEQQRDPKPVQRQRGDKRRRGPTRVPARLRLARRSRGALGRVSAIVPLRDSRVRQCRKIEYRLPLRDEIAPPRMHDDPSFNLLLRADCRKIAAADEREGPSAEMVNGGCRQRVGGCRAATLAESALPRHPPRILPAGRRLDTSR